MFIEVPVVECPKWHEVDDTLCGLPVTLQPLDDRLNASLLRLMQHRRDDNIPRNLIQTWGPQSKDLRQSSWVGIRIGLWHRA